MHIYLWGNNPVRAKYKGELCKVLAYGKKNSILVEFKDGHQMVTSRNSVRRNK